MEQTTRSYEDRMHEQYKEDTVTIFAALLSGTDWAMLSPQTRRAKYRELAADARYLAAQARKPMADG